MTLRRGPVPSSPLWEHKETLNKVEESGTEGNVFLTFQGIAEDKGKLGVKSLAK